MSPAYAVGDQVVYSQLWGREGELWGPAGRLPDFSYAGYRNGERAIPDYPVETRVDAFGAKGDDDLDDTEAFKAAVAKTKAGAIFIPTGRYIISDMVWITRPGVVLRGAGMERTTLFFTTPLQTLKPNNGATTGGKPTSNYSWSGGLVRLQGDFGSAVLTPVTAGALRGEKIITVEKPQTLSVGQVIEVRVTDTPANTLTRHLYSDDADDISKIEGKMATSQISRITGIDGNRIELERPLRFNVRLEWSPVVRVFSPTVQDSGVEDLTFEFPVSTYEGHFTEQGFNPVAFVNVAHCWARRLKFINPDSGPMVGGVFNTVADVVYESKRPPDKRGNQGHHGIYLQHIGDHLFTRFDIRMRFVHDVTVSRCAGVVVSQGKGMDLCFDNHKRAPYETLFTMIDLGKGTRPWSSGGGDALGKNAGARITFWNLRAERMLPHPPKAFAPWSMNLVGVPLKGPVAMESGSVWREATESGGVQPTDLHAAQLAKRLGRDLN